MRNLARTAADARIDKVHRRVIEIINLPHGAPPDFDLSQFVYYGREIISAVFELYKDDAVAQHGSISREDLERVLRSQHRHVCNRLLEQDNFAQIANQNGLIDEAAARKFVTAVRQAELTLARQWRLEGNIMF